MELRAACQLDAQPIGLRCGCCDHPFSKTVGWARTHERVTCPACGAEAPFDNSKLKASFTNALRELSLLRATLPADLPIELKF